MRWCILVTIAAVASPPACVAPLAAQEVLAGDERAPRFLLASATPSRAPQQVDVDRTPVLRRRISVTLLDVPLEEALKTIASQSGLDLAYSRTAASLGRLVRLDARDITVAAALTEVLLDAQVDVVFTRRGRAMLVRRGEQSEQEVGAISGRVTDSKTGQALDGAEVLLEGTQWRTLAGQDGQYRLAEVEAGSYTVVARRIGYGRQVRALTVVAEQELTADFALQPTPTKLDEVVVTGTFVPTEVKALPTPVTIISAEEIAEAQPRTINEVIRQFVPGAVAWDLASNPTQTPFSVRGASTLSPGSGSMKVLIDGIEVADRSQTPIDPASIERVEVVRGPQAGAIYGSDAIAGVIQIFTKRGQENAPPSMAGEAAVGVVQSPYDGYSGALKQSYRASLSGGTGKVTYNVAAGYVHLGEWTLEGASSYPSANFGLRLADRALTLDVFGRYYAQATQSVLAPELVGSGFMPAAGPLYTPTRFDEQTYGLRAVYSASRTWQHAFVAGSDRFAWDIHQTQPRFTTPSDSLLTVSARNRTRTLIGYNTSLLLPVGNDVSGNLTAGFDHYALRGNAFSASGVNADGTIRTPANRIPSTSRFVVNNTGYFAQAQVGVREAFFLTAGVRVEDNATFGEGLGTPVKPRIGGSFVRPVGTSVVKLRASYGESIRPPEPGQRGGFVSGSTTQLANEDLGPEQQTGWDAGVDIDIADWGFLGVTYYRQVALDFIQAVVVNDPGAPRTIQNQNVGRLRNTGIEVEGRVRMNVVSVTLTYSYAKSLVTEVGPRYTGDLRVGDQALLTPHHTAGATLSASPAPGLALSAGMTYVGEWTYYDVFAQFSCFGGTAPCRATNRDYLTTYPSFAKFNVGASYPLRTDLGVFLAVENATNEQVFELSDTSPRIGRITTVGLRFKL